jgi:hypothetical protein
MASKWRLRKSETHCGAYGANLNGSIWFSFQALACCSFLVSPALSQFGLTRTRDLWRDSLPVSGFSTTTYKPVGNA